MIIIKNCNLWTMENINNEKGSILIDGKKIIDVSKIDLSIKYPSIKVIDAKNLFVMPGIVDPHCHIGMMEQIYGWPGSDTNEITNPITPELKGIESIKPHDASFKEALTNGVTTVCTGPGSANIIGGTFTVLKTKGKTVFDMMVKEEVAMKMALGENPKRCYKDKGNYDYEQINTLTQNISDRMTQVNQMQMEQLGLAESQNPLEIVATPVEAILIANRKSKSIFIPAKTQEMDNQSILTFNAKFENYAGTNIQGTTVRGLLTTISSNNGISDNEEINSGISTTSSRKIEEINFNGEEFEVNGQNIAALKEEIVPTNYYKVEFEKNQTTGAIYRVVINNK